MIPYGVYRMTVTGPPALLNKVGPIDVEIVGDDEANLEYGACDEVARQAGYEGYDYMPEECTPIDFTEPVLTANEFQNPDGSQQWFVGVYAVGRAFGGREEGGWWYDTGELVRQTAVATRGDAERLRTQLRTEFPDTGASSSVLGGEDHRIAINLKPHAPYFPEDRPRYE